MALTALGTIALGLALLAGRAPGEGYGPEAGGRAPGGEAVGAAMPLPGADARAELEAALRSGAADPAPLLALAAEIARDDPTAGLVAHRRIAAAHPRSPAARTALGRAFLVAGDRRGARAETDRALALGPETPDALLLSGEVHVGAARPDLDAARHAWARALELAPDSPAGREAASLLRLHEGR